jgi:group II intron reverse transcriptase/maturase
MPRVLFCLKATTISPFRWARRGSYPYEQDFLDCSYGFRPGRSAHDAVRTLDQIVHRGEVSWILEADIVSFFDSIDRNELKKMLETRVADGSLLRLIGKCLQVGVLDSAELSAPETGTAQGSVLSPLLGNVYLHYALDLWFETEVKPRLRGRATLIRYADDFVIGFEHEEDARRVLAVLGKRLARFGLTLHPDKTRLLPFRRPPAGQKSGKGSASFDFLGFTLYWARSRRGRWGSVPALAAAATGDAAGSVAALTARIDEELAPKEHG